MALKKTVIVFVFAVFQCVVSYSTFGQAIDAEAPNIPTPPPQVTDVGYIQLSFFSRFDKKTIDLQRSRRRGFDWYLNRFFGWSPVNADHLKFDEDGTITLDGDFSANYGIATAGPNITGSGWIGRAFGGGAYFEASLKFDPEDHRRANFKGWPSFWSMSIEHLANMKEQYWLGQEKYYEHFIEADFFEYGLLKYGVPENYYIGALHDWYGIYKKTCPKKHCSATTEVPALKRRMPENTDFNDFHRYGFLWVPATDTSNGYAEWYLDGKPVGPRTTWTRFNDQRPPPGKAPWTFGIIDRQHLVLILGTGKDQPMTVKYVAVWQVTEDGNLTR